MAKRRRDEFVVGRPAGSMSAIRTLQAWNPHLEQIYRLVPVTVAEVEAQAKRERKARKGKCG